MTSKIASLARALALVLPILLLAGFPPPASAASRGAQGGLTTATPTPVPTMSTGGPGGPGSGLPTLSPAMLVVLGLGMASAALVLFRRRG